MVDIRQPTMSTTKRIFTHIRNSTIHFNIATNIYNHISRNINGIRIVITIKVIAIINHDIIDIGHIRNRTSTSTRTRTGTSTRTSTRMCASTSMRAVNDDLTRASNNNRTYYT